mgnify:CR=1 FL=1
MKRILIATVASLALIGTAQAQHHGHYGHQYRHYAGGPGWGWVFPAVVGGAVVYAATRPAQAEPVIVQQPPVVIAQPVPTGQVILQNTGIVCPQGTAAFYNQRIDRYGRTFYEFDTCK